MKITLMLMRLSWKNIWRNKFRSILILSAIAIGLFAGTFTIAFIAGWGRATIETEICNQLSHTQIHTPEFSYNYDINSYFFQDQVAPVIDSVTHLNSVSYRLKLYGVLASASNTVGTFVHAIDPEDEIATTTLHQYIPDSLGTFLQSGKLPIVISQRTAKKLKARLKSKVVLSMQDAKGDMQSMAFRVGGIFKTNNSMFDESTIFVRKSDILPYTGLPAGVAHEVAILAENVSSGKTVTEALSKALPQMDVQGWNELQPALGLIHAWTDLINVIILSIFLVALSFGIVNTMLMAVLERTKELGVLACIGMNKRNIFKMVMFETLCLTVVGSAVGILLASWVIGYTGEHGIDLGFMLNANYERFGFSSVVYPILETRAFLEIIALVVITGMISAIYPARKALKINSWEATKC